MKREFKLNFSGILGIFIAGVVVGILGYFSVSVIKNIPTSSPEGIVRDYYLLIARTSYSGSATTLGKEYEDNKLAANEKYKRKIVYLFGEITDFGEIDGIPVLYLDAEMDEGYVACKMQKRVLPILAEMKKEQYRRVVGEVVGTVSDDSNIYLKNCLIHPPREQLNERFIDDE